MNKKTKKANKTNKQLYVLLVFLVCQFFCKFVSLLICKFLIVVSLALRASVVGERSAVIEDQL